MSKKAQDNKNKGSRNSPPDRFQPKVLMIWLAILAAIIGIWSIANQGGTRIERWSMQQLIRQLEAQNIQSLSMKNDPNSGHQFYTVQGQLKQGASQVSGTQATVDGSSTQSKQLRPPLFEAQGRMTDTMYNQIAELAEAQGIVFKDVPTTTTFKEVLISLLPFILIIGLLYFLFTRQLKMAGKGAMSFGKTKARMLTRDKEHVHFKDVAGCDEAKEDVAEIVQFLKDPKKFQRIGGRVPKGMLMVGPPGTGKTLLAKAVAGEADVPFFSISGSDFVEMFVGVGAARVRDMFEQGRKNAPCLMFIDEIDAVGRQRGAGLGGGNDEREQTLNSLLVEMDGFDSHEGVIIIAATNRPDVLDSALLRPGRFDRQVTIDLPDMNGREAILQVHAKKIKMEEEVDLSIVARNTPGFSGADLANLLNESALIAARYNKKKVAMADIDHAREKIAFGSERRKLMDDEDKRMTAYHEAGHALVQAVIDDGTLPLHKVSIIPRGQALGLTMMVPKKDLLGQSKKQLLNQICMAMAGRIGEEIETNDFSNGAASDIKQATRIARHMVCDWGMSDLGPIALGENQDHIFLGKEITRNQNYSESTAREIDTLIQGMINEQYERAKEIIASRKDKLEMIAQGLLEYETLEGAHVYEIVEFGEMRTPIQKASEKHSKSEDEASGEESNASSQSDDGELGHGNEPAGVPA